MSIDQSSLAATVVLSIVLELPSVFLQLPGPIDLSVS